MQVLLIKHTGSHKDRFLSKQGLLLSNMNRHQTRHFSYDSLYRFEIDYKSLMNQSKYFAESFKTGKIQLISIMFTF